MATAPSVETIKGLLKGLVTRGLLMWSVIDDCRGLLSLRSVQQAAPQGAQSTPEELYEALVAYLPTAVAKVEKLQYQRLLTIALAIDEEFRGTTAIVRRTAAGERFRIGEAGSVTAGNIRQHHEPRALEALAEIIHRDEMDLLGGSD